ERGEHLGQQHRPVFAGGGGPPDALAPERPLLLFRGLGHELIVPPIAPARRPCYLVARPARLPATTSFPMRCLIASTGVVLLAVALFGRAPAADDYVMGPDSYPHDGVPRGKVTHFKWDKSKVYEGTERDCWVYVPEQYDGKTPACVMVFQDGGNYVHVE